MGGLFVWVTLPSGLDAQKLFEVALRENVAFVPGDSFYAPNGHHDEALRHMRLNFSAAPPEQIREGIRRLSVAVKQQLLELHPADSALR
jgi:2-aminoadipate transaminase